MISIDTSSRILIDGRATGLALIQKGSGTVICTPESRTSGTQYKEHQMPHTRYSTAHDHPASGVAGRAQLEADIVALLKTINE